MSKIILITGASSGIGKATALQLIHEGHIVYTAARRAEKMNDIAEKGGFSLQMDITKEADINYVVDTIIGKEGRIDVLFNNAGYAIYGAIEDIKIDEARRQFEVNLFGLANITQKVLPHMRSQKSGLIINTSSMGGKMYTPLGAWYHATKYALEGWSDCLRLEVAPFGIDVVILEPGAINTEFGDVMLQPMVDRSKGGAYEDLAKAVAEATGALYQKEGGSPVSLIANTVSKSIKTSKPKTRYLVGKFAKPLVFIRKYFGDRIFDKAVMLQINQIIKKRKP